MVVKWTSVPSPCAPVLRRSAMMPGSCACEAERVAVQRRHQLTRL